MTQPTNEELIEIARVARAPYQERLAAAETKEERTAILRESHAAVASATSAAMLQE